MPTHEKPRHAAIPTVYKGGAAPSLIDSDNLEIGRFTFALDGRSTVASAVGCNANSGWGLHYGIQRYETFGPYNHQKDEECHYCGMVMACGSVCGRDLWHHWIEAGNLVQWRSPRARP